MTRRLLAGLALLFAFTAQAAVNEQLIAKERSMWEMWKRKDAQSFAALLADDFHDVYLSGETVGKAELMKGFADADLLDYRLGRIDVVNVSPDTRILLYRAHIRGKVNGQELEYDVDVTSGWSLRKKEWRSVFYRENLVPERLPWSKLTATRKP